MPRFKSKRAKVHAFLTIAACLVSSSAFAAPNLISNGSFESPALPPGSDFLVVPVGSPTIPGWSIVGGPGESLAVVEELYNLPDGAGIDFAAADGAQWIDLSGPGVNANDGVLQSVSLNAGSYILSFSVGNVIAPAAFLGTQSRADLWINGTFAQSFTNPGSGGGAINWQPFSYTFGANGSTSIEFRNGDGFGDNFNGLDNVVLSAVPEPSSAAILLLGIVVAGYVVRVRSARLRATA